MIKDEIQQLKSLLQQGWTQGTTARNVDHHAVDPLDESAVVWSIDGAIEKISGGNGLNIQRLKMWISEYLRCLQFHRAPIYLWNDAFCRTQQDVIAFLDLMMLDLED